MSAPEPPPLGPQSFDALVFTLRFFAERQDRDGGLAEHELLAYCQLCRLVEERCRLARLRLASRADALEAGRDDDAGPEGEA
jgi:hypothetical protein